MIDDNENETENKKQITYIQHIKYKMYNDSFTY